MTNTPLRCCQCPKFAIWRFQDDNSAGLCVDCYYKFEVAKTLEFRMLAISMNHATDEMDMATGLIGFGARIQVPEIPKGPPILNNITVNNSTLGVLNTGTVQTIDVSISSLSQAGNEEISDALTKLTDMLVDATELDTTAKNDALEQVAYLSQQAICALSERKPGMIKATIGSLAETAKSVATLAAAWPQLQPLITKFFNLIS